MKNAISTLKRNLIYSAAYQIFNILIPLITAPYVARVLGVNNIGLYSVSFSIAHIFQSVAYLGLNNYGTRAIARTRHSREETSRRFCEIFCMQALSGVLTLGAYFLYCTRMEGVERALALISSLYVAVACIDISWFYFGLENFRVTVIRNMLIRLLSAAAVFLFVKTDADLLIYMAIVMGGTFLGQITLWFYLGQYVSLVRVSPRNVVRHIKPNLILFIPVISINVYKYMDKVMIGALSDTFQAGLYESAEKITRVPSSVLTAFGMVMLSRASGRDGEHNGRKSVTVSMILIMFAASLMCFGIMACADMFVPVYYGAGYSDCIVLMQYLALSVLAVAWANVIRTQCLIPNSHDRFYAVSISAGAVANFFLNWLLIRKMGAMGAVVATVVTETLIAVLQTAYCRAEFDLPECLRSSAPFVCFGAMTCAAAGISKRMEADPVRLILLVAAFSGMYGILSFAYLYQRHRPILRMILPDRKARRKRHEKSSDCGNQSGDKD